MPIFFGQALMLLLDEKKGTYNGQTVGSGFFGRSRSVFLISSCNG
jgi:hypothetical protein